MQQEKQFLLDLKKHFRLNIYEVKIWTSLLTRGIASAGELADISGVPRSRCYDVLESLEKKGFIIMNIGKPIKYLAVQPDVIIERVKQNIRDEAETLAVQIENVKDTEEFKDLELLHKTGIQHVDIASISKSIVGRSAVNRHIKDMLHAAKSNVIVASTQESIERVVKLLKGVMPGMANKGAKLKFLAHAFCLHPVNLGMHRLFGYLPLFLLPKAPCNRPFQKFFQSPLFPQYCASLGQGQYLSPSA